MMKKIAMISDHASPLADPGSVDSGGQNVYIAQVAKHLASMGYEVDIFTRKDKEDLAEVYEWHPGIRVIHVPAGPAEYIQKEDLFTHMGAFTAYVIQFIQQQEIPYSLIHAHFWMSAMIAANIKKQLGIPFVVTFHALGRVRRIYQGKQDGFPDVRFDVEDRVVAEADHIIAECPQDEQDLLRLYQAAPEKITIIPCGFDPVELWPLDKALSRIVLGIPAEERVVLQLGRMVPRKGIDTVIRGFARMMKKHRLAARLMIVGGESENPNLEKTHEISRLKAITIEEGIQKRVYFTGRKDRQALKFYYSAADIFVSTPWYEPFGITPVEAMACGTPVIGSDVGGIKYTVLDGETGYLVPPNDWITLSERMSDLLQNPDKLKRLGMQAAKRANDMFTWMKVAEAISNLYEQITVSNITATNLTIEANNRVLIDQGFEKAIQALQVSQKTLQTPILKAAQIIHETLERGNKVLICADRNRYGEAQRFAADLGNRFAILGIQTSPILYLTDQISFLPTRLNSNNDQIFAHQVEASGTAGDLLVGFSTSGCSSELIEAFKMAKLKSLLNLAFLGGDGGDLLQLADQSIVVASNDSQCIQEIHFLAQHLICELIEVDFMTPSTLLNPDAKESSWELIPTPLTLGQTGKEI